MGRLDVHIRHGGGGGDSAGPIAVVVILVVAAAALRAAWGALAVALHVILTALEVIAWTLAGATIAAVVGGGVWAGLRIRHAVHDRRGHRAASAPPVITVIPEPAARPAIEPPRPSADSWPLPGWWTEVRPHIGRDGDEHRPTGGTS
jgi:hypothetical protein